LDQGDWITLHDHAIGKSAAVTFVSVADDIFLVGRSIRNGLPFDAGRETGTAAPAQPRFRPLSDDRLRPNLNGAFEPLPAVKGGIVRKRQRIDNAAAGKGEASLAREK